MSIPHILPASLPARQLAGINRIVADDLRIARAQERRARRRADIAHEHISSNILSDPKDSLYLFAGSIVMARTQIIRPPHGRGGGPRSPITQFSPQSRKRLMDKLARWRVLPTHLMTLTYPDEPLEDEKAHRRDLAAFKKRLARAFPSAQGFWRVEYKPRRSGRLVGVIMPHFHLLVALPPVQMDLFKRWLSRAWNEVCARPDWSDENRRRHLRAGTNISQIANARASVAYASKYAAKVGECSGTGRHWGMIGKPDMRPLAIIEMPVAKGEAIRAGIIRALLSRAKPDSFWAMWLSGQKPLMQKLTLYSSGLRQSGYKIARSINQRFKERLIDEDEFVASWQGLMRDAQSRTARSRPAKALWRPSNPSNISRLRNCPLTDKKIHANMRMRAPF